ncbi:unnamed protein product, partial [Prorocentrum cordatum]
RRRRRRRRSRTDLTLGRAARRLRGARPSLTRTLRHCLTSPRPMRSHGAANLEAIAAKLDRQEPRPRHVPPPCEAERAARASGPESWAKAPAAKGLRRQDVRATVPLRGVKPSARGKKECRPRASRPRGAPQAAPPRGRAWGPHDRLRPLGTRRGSEPRRGVSYSPPSGRPASAHAARSAARAPLPSGLFCNRSACRPGRASGARRASSQRAAPSSPTRLLESPRNCRFSRPQGPGVPRPNAPRPRPPRGCRRGRAPAAPAARRGPRPDAPRPRPPRGFWRGRAPAAPAARREPRPGAPRPRPPRGCRPCGAPAAAARRQR